MILLAAIAVFAFWFLFAIDMIGNGGRMIVLRDLPAGNDDALPKVSMIVPCCNEQARVESAMNSLLALDYPDFEVIAVNDRSFDQTGEILDRLSKADPRLQILHVTQLPPGWLGKNHALELGAGQATGEWLLFTDGDVHLSPTTLRKAIGHCLRASRDHVAALPEATMPTLPLKIFVACFGIYFSMFARPWKASDPRSRCHCGIGAFNLVRARAFRAAHGFESIKMRPDDDLMLGKILKMSGAKQEALVGIGEVKVEWYSSLGEVIRGLEKNSFASLRYSVGVLIAATLGQLLVNIWPFVAAFTLQGMARTFALATVIIILGLMSLTAPSSGAPFWSGLAYPFVGVFFLYIQWNSAIKALARGGIDWRGTLYSLKELRQNRV